ncbi:hypothetical protein GCM10017083_15710 [Thalassobaculum fulvum]|uniref:HrgA protein n=1 Tax=Thalassobaculum fulvum TaxID=1633335 RepID=A0A918XQ75_9PROT|nr:hypothetical protein [Thalassobaculum fulvum]GHD46519.1 hypothetical protein GCM10017083_15710 [Thalassobaculum fulvum]
MELLKSQPGSRFTARQIAEWIAARYPAAVQAKLEKSSAVNSHAEVMNQIVAEIGASRPNWERQVPQLRTTEGIRPRQFYWTEKSEEQEVHDAERTPSRKELSTQFESGDGTGGSEVDVDVQLEVSEAELYPILIEFMEGEYPFKGVRIDERRSSNAYGRGGNRWLFPDVVGMEDLTRGLDSEVKLAVRESRDRRIRLWSFEVKLLVNRSNARETYFQAVSNSSWANFGYLVASRIEGSDTIKELRILYAMHGIGLILLNVEDPAESQILIPSRERLDIEWSMCSRLAAENRDFKSFMRRVRQFFQTGDMQES